MGFPIEGPDTSSLMQIQGSDMNSLLRKAIVAHGGIGQWEKVHAITADVSVGGALWESKGVAGLLSQTEVVSFTRQQHMMIRLQAHQKTISYSPDRVIVRNDHGDILDLQDDPRSNLFSLGSTARWGEAQAGYFDGYALWQYLNAPFLFSYPGFEVEDAGTWLEDGESWDVLKVTFPSNFVGHTKVQWAYFGRDGLLRRQRYSVNVLKDVTAVNYASDYRSIDGIMVPMRRRVLGCDAKGNKIPLPVLVSIDINNAECIRLGQSSPLSIL
jgi:hypothetical protein